MLDAESQQQVLRSFRASRIILPVLLGVAAVGYLFYRQFDLAQFRSIRWSAHAFVWIGIALLLLVVRHAFYAFRLRTLTGFSWRKSAELIVIWEFSAALTPTSKGGPFVMLFVLAREKLSAGRTAAAVFYTMVCDSGFFMLILPLLLGIYGPPMLYPGMKTYGAVGLASGTFFVTYGLMVTYWCILVFLLLGRPRYAKIVLDWLAQRALLKRFAPKLNLLGDEFALAATELRRQNGRYHLGVIAPLALPFDLHRETVNACLEQLEMKRGSILETLWNGKWEKRWEDKVIALEYLGISGQEAAIITGNSVPNPWEYWGFSAQTVTISGAAKNWDILLAEDIQLLLQKAGLSYDELLQILDAWYVNPEVGPNGKRQIVFNENPAAPACDTAQMHLIGLDTAALARIIRFVRLWRKLGWSVQDVDRAVRKSGNNTLEEACLISLSQLKRLQEQTQIPV